MANIKKTVWVYVGIAVGIVVLLNVVARNWFVRVDLTDNQVYSLSISSKAVLNKATDLLTAKVYFSDNLPGQYGNTRRYLQDILEEYEAYSNGNLRFEFYRPEDDEELSQEAMTYGIQPVQLQVIENDKMEIKRVYMGLVFFYEDNREVIPVVQTTTGLEYELTSKIKKMVDPKRPVLGFATFEGQEVMNESIRTQLSEAYRLDDVPLTSEVPFDLNLLFINGVTDSISTDEYANLAKYADKGGNIFLAQGQVEAELSTQRGARIESNLFDLLERYEISVEDNLVLDAQCNNVTVTQSRGFFRMNTAVPYPFFPLVSNFGNHVTVSGLERAHVMYPSEITWDLADSSSMVVPLFYTSERSGTMAGFYNLSPLENPAFKTLTEDAKVVAVYATSQGETTTSQLVYVSDSGFLSDAAGGRMPENALFTMNAVDVMVGDRDLVALRSREITSRPLVTLEDGARATWKSLNVVLPALLVVAYGLLQWRLEAGRTKRLEEQYG